jgi:FKBP-type peptidyl-prolyl cis-trans isomerase
MKQDLGYFYGYSFGNMMKQGNTTDVDLDRLLQGLKDSLDDVPPALDAERRDAIYAEIRKRQEEAAAEQETRTQAASAANLQQAEDFLKTNSGQEGVSVTGSGLQYRVLEEKEGANAGADARVVVNYKGSFINGDIFDQSTTGPAEFGLNQVIPAWTEGLQLMSPGDKYQFFVHPGLAYGAGGVGRIPPNSLLIFEIELLEIK